MPLGDKPLCNSTDTHNELQNYDFTHCKDYVEGVSKCDFAMSRDVACRVSMFATTYKTFNINSLFNQIVETQNFASLLPH